MKEGVFRRISLPLADKAVDGSYRSAKIKRNAANTTYHA
jgi:hypothetical protein